MERFVETTDHYFVYYGRHAAFIIPKSWTGASSDAVGHALGMYMQPSAVG
ncbi:MAG: YcxB family protein [bacterium]